MGSSSPWPLLLMLLPTTMTVWGDTAANKADGHSWIILMKRGNDASARNDRKRPDVRDSQALNLLKTLQGLHYTQYYYYTLGNTYFLVASHVDISSRSSTNSRDADLDCCQYSTCCSAAASSTPTAHVPPYRISCIHHMHMQQQLLLTPVTP